MPTFEDRSAENEKISQRAGLTAASEGNLAGVSPAPRSLDLRKSMPFNWLLQSAELNQILKQKPARLPAHNMKGYGDLIEPSEFDWSEAS